MSATTWLVAGKMRTPTACHHRRILEGDGHVSSDLPFFFFFPSLRSCGEKLWLPMTCWFPRTTQSTHDPVISHEWDSWFAS